MKRNETNIWLLFTWTIICQIVCVLRGSYVFLIDVGLKRNPFVNKFARNESMTRFWPRNTVWANVALFQGRISVFFNSFQIDGNWIREIQTISKKAKCRIGSDVASSIMLYALHSWTWLKSLTRIWTTFPTSTFPHFHFTSLHYFNSSNSILWKHCFFFCISYLFFAIVVLYFQWSLY